MDAIEKRAQERARFDAWVKASGSYSWNGFNRMEDMWDAWQAALTPPEGEQLIESDKDVALAQAVEFADYVERQAKGAMVDAAKRFLSLPYAQELAKRLTPPEGHVVVTRDEDGEIVMVSRQNDDHQVLEVIALTTHAGGKRCECVPPEGYVLVPVEPTDAMLNSPSINCGPRTAANVWTGMLAARPEVKP